MIAEDDDGSGQNYFSRITTLLESGTYYLKVRDYSEGRYSIILTTSQYDGTPSPGNPGCPDSAEDGDDVYTGAENLPLDTIIDRTLDTDDEDWFKITIE